VRLYNSRRRCAVGNHARSAQFDNPAPRFRNARNIFQIQSFLLRGALRIRTRAAQRDAEGALILSTFVYAQLYNQTIPKKDVLWRDELLPIDPNGTQHIRKLLASAGTRVRLGSNSQST